MYIREKAIKAIQPEASRNPYPLLLHINIRIRIRIRIQPIPYRYPGIHIWPYPYPPDSQQHGERPYFIFADPSCGVFSHKVQATLQGYVTHIRLLPRLFPFPPSTSPSPSPHPAPPLLSALYEICILCMYTPHLEYLCTYSALPLLPAADLLS